MFKHWNYKVTLTLEIVIKMIGLCHFFNFDLIKF